MKNLLLASAAAAAVIFGTTGQGMAGDIGSMPSSSAYVSLFGGLAFPGDIHGNYYGSTAVSIDGDMGFLLGAAIGTHITDSLRGEVELSYAMTDVDDSNFWDQSFNGPDPASGDLGVVYLMANAWYDFNTGSGFTPYIGGGLGAAVLLPDITLYTPPGDTLTDTGWGAAGQLGVGVTWDITDAAKLDFGYRAKAILSGSLPGDCSSGRACAIDDVFMVTHIVQVGLTYAF